MCMLVYTVFVCKCKALRGVFYCKNAIAKFDQTQRGTRNQSKLGSRQYCTSSPSQSGENELDDLILVDKTTRQLPSVAQYRCSVLFTESEDLWPFRYTSPTEQFLKCYDHENHGASCAQCLIQLYMEPSQPEMSRLGNQAPDTLLAIRRRVYRYLGCEEAHPEDQKICSDEWHERLDREPNECPKCRRFWYLTPKWRLSDRPFVSVYSQALDWIESLVCMGETCTNTTRSSVQLNDACSALASVNQDLASIVSDRRSPLDSHALNGQGHQAARYQLLAMNPNHHSHSHYNERLGRNTDRRDGGNASNSTEANMGSMRVRLQKNLNETLRRVSGPSSRLTWPGSWNTDDNRQRSRELKKWDKLNSQIAKATQRRSIIEDKLHYGDGYANSGGSAPDNSSPGMLEICKKTTQASDNTITRQDDGSSDSCKESEAQSSNVKGKGRKLSVSLPSSPATSLENRIMRAGEAAKVTFQTPLNARVRSEPTDRDIGKMEGTFFAHSAVQDSSKNQIESSPYRDSVTQSSVYDSVPDDCQNHPGPANKSSIGIAENLIPIIKVTNPDPGALPMPIDPADVEDYSDNEQQHQRHSIAESKADFEPRMSRSCNLQSKDRGSASSIGSSRSLRNILGRSRPPLRRRGSVHGSMTALITQGDGEDENMASAGESSN